MLVVPSSTAPPRASPSAVLRALARTFAVGQQGVPLRRGALQVLALLGPLSPPLRSGSGTVVTLRVGVGVGTIGPSAAPPRGRMRAGVVSSSAGPGFVVELARLGLVDPTLLAEGVRGVVEPGPPRLGLGPVVLRDVLLALFDAECGLGGRLSGGAPFSKGQRPLLRGAAAGSIVAAAGVTLCVSEPRCLGALLPAPARVDGGE
ncbi:hypothetical protein VTK73DRAFT_620 [Phialemonium thermophilum]|uniref:Secreted protein n=1 Tax=Phialemonium thermophilum TaxID=223376 RepID=A0ABR3VUM0_9PEZI